MLHEWTRSEDGGQTYNCLLEDFQQPLAPEELILTLIALISFHCMKHSTEPEDEQQSQHVQLVDVDRLCSVHGCVQSNQAILRDMVFSFSRVIVHGVDLSLYSSYMRFLDPALAALSTAEQSHDRILDHYWLKRLPSPTSHSDAIN